MKKMMLFFALVMAGLFFSTTVSAQFKIGPRAGLNLATISDVDEFDTKTLTGFTVGAVAEIGVSDAFSIQPEVAFTRKGTRIEAPFFGDGGFRTNYLDVFILGKYAFGGESGIGGYVAVGPQLGYYMSGEIFSDDANETEDIPDESINDFEFGISAGGGVTYMVENGPTLFLDLRYVLGLTNWVEEDDDIDASNRAIGISVGALFTIGGE